MARLRYPSACLHRRHAHRGGSRLAGSSAAVLAAGLTLGLAACDADDGEPSERLYELEFDVVFGAQPFRCGGSYPGAGASASTVEPRDIRFYVYDVAVVDAAGQAVALDLVEDGQWQRDGVALLDFVDDTGLCATGDTATNLTVRGRGAPIDVAAVRFTIGLPEALNHIDAARAATPFNDPGMWWSWTGGFKYMRIDAKTAGNDNWYIHMGATGCEGTPEQGIACAFGNRATVTVTGVNPDAPRVVLDMQALYAGNDLDAPIDFMSDFVNGCMAFPGDPECPSVFSGLGLTFMADEPRQATAFRGE
jgi:uncharacterized repeat protein (TIGR04052 family)